MDASSVSLARRLNHAGTGSASVPRTVHGSSLGLVAFTALGRVGQTGCEGTEWESETSVRCLVGHGVRGTLRVTVAAGERGGSMLEGPSPADLAGQPAVRLRGLPQASPQVCKDVAYCSKDCHVCVASHHAGLLPKR